MKILNIELLPLQESSNKGTIEATDLLVAYNNGVDERIRSMTIAIIAFGEELTPSTRTTLSEKYKPESEAALLMAQLLVGILTS